MQLDRHSAIKDTYLASASQSSVMENSLYCSTFLALSCSSFLLSARAFFRSSSSLPIQLKLIKKMQLACRPFVGTRREIYDRCPYSTCFRLGIHGPCVCSPPKLSEGRGHHRRHLGAHR